MSHARSFVRDALVTANVGTDVVERATLLVSELVTNTVVHTLSSSVEITVGSSPVSHTSRYGIGATACRRCPRRDRVTLRGTA